jgi:amidase
MVHDFHDVSVVAGSVGSGEKEWQMVAHRKQADRAQEMAKFPDWRVKVRSAKISDVSQFPFEKLTTTERIIVKCDATALTDLIRKRVYTSVEVLIAFAKAAIVAQDVTNCLTEIFIEEALQRAQELDKYLEESGQVVGPLHGQPLFTSYLGISVHIEYAGLPVSIKDHIKIK